MGQSFDVFECWTTADLKNDHKPVDVVDKEDDMEWASRAQATSFAVTYTQGEMAPPLVSVKSGPNNRSKTRNTASQAGQNPRTKIDRLKCHLEGRVAGDEDVGGANWPGSSDTCVFVDDLWTHRIIWPNTMNDMQKNRRICGK